MRGKCAHGNENACNGEQLARMRAGGTVLRVRNTRPEFGCRRKALEVVLKLVRVTW